MSTDRWFRHYERLQARYPSLPDDVLADAARDAERDEIAERADAARTRAKEERGVR